MAVDRPPRQETAATRSGIAAWAVVLRVGPSNPGRAVAFRHVARFAPAIPGKLRPHGADRALGWAFRALVVLLLPIVGCATPPDPGSTGTLEGTEWTLTALEGRAPLAGTRVSLEVADTTLGGYDGCNWYGGSYDADDGRLRVGPIQSTARGCLQEGVGEQEARYHDALGRATGYRLATDVLELTGASGEVLLAFARRDPAQVDPVDLVGTAWRLEAVRSPDGTAEDADTTVTVEFPEPGVVRGFAGCRDYTGTWEARGDRLYFTSFHMSSLECDRGDRVIVREGDFTTHLGESTYWRFADGRLELTTHGGRRLTFVPR